MSHRLKMIPLCQLRCSKQNMRKTDRLADLEPLAASILANGVLQSLVAIPLKGNGRELQLYDVTAGGRRLAALRLLVKRRRIERDEPVPCLLKNNAANATEISLAENFSRVPPHPADQFEAFADLVHQGSSAAEIASRFGISETFVQQRLKLSAVSPRLIAEYRAGAMTLEQLTAFTLSNSHALQEEVWFERAYADMPAQLVRRLLTNTQVAGDDPRARFVGAKAYEAAGGVILRDLFDAEDEGYYSDSQLLDRLVAEKLEQTAQIVRGENWQWVEIYPTTDLGTFSQYGRADTVERQLDEAEEARLAELADHYDALATAAEDGDDNAQVELERVGNELDALQAKNIDWTEDEKSRAGVLICLNQDGEVETVRGVLKPELNGNGQARPQPAKDRKQAGNGYSAAVLSDLAAHRTAALREVLAQNPDVAFTALLHGLVNQLFYRGSPLSCVGVKATEVVLPSASSTVADGKAAQAFTARHQAWLARLPEIEGLWAFLEQLSHEDRQILLAHCVALTANALHGRTGAQEDAAVALATVLNLDMRMWWSPAREHFLNRITKNDILAAVSEGVSQQASWRLASLKKERMAREAEKLLAESSWVPALFRRPQPSTQNLT